MIIQALTHAKIKFPGQYEGGEEKGTSFLTMKNVVSPMTHFQIEFGGFNLACTLGRGPRCVFGERERRFEFFASLHPLTT